MTKPYLLYFSEGTASLAPKILLAEAGIQHEIVHLDVNAGEHRKPAYLAINPAAQVPALVTPEGQVITEAAAICLYLIDRHQLEQQGPMVGDPDRGPFLSALLFQATSVQDHFKRIYYPSRYLTSNQDVEAIKMLHLQKILDALGLIEKKLADAGPYHLGQRSSVADTYLVMLLSWLPDAELHLKSFPSVSRCRVLVCERPLVKADLALQHQISVQRTD